MNDRNPGALALLEAFKIIERRFSVNDLDKEQMNKKNNPDESFKNINIDNPTWWNDLWGAIGNFQEKYKWRQSVCLTNQEQVDLTEKWFKEAARELAEKATLFTQKLND